MLHNEVLSMERIHYRSDWSGQENNTDHVLTHAIGVNPVC